MNTGLFTTNVTLQTMTASVDSGDRDETWDAGVSRRVDIKQIDGTRYLAVEQLTDREVYRVRLWDHDIAPNIRIVYGSKTLYPIRPVLRNTDRSLRNVVTLIMATKV